MDSEDDMHDANDVESVEDFYSGDTAASDDDERDFDFAKSDDSDDETFHPQRVNLTCPFSLDKNQIFSCFFFFLGGLNDWKYCWGFDEFDVRMEEIVGFDEVSDNGVKKFWGFGLVQIS